MLVLLTTRVCARVCGRVRFSSEHAGALQLQLARPCFWGTGIPDLRNTSRKTSCSALKKKITQMAYTFCKEKKGSCFLRCYCACCCYLVHRVFLRIDISTSGVLKHGGSIFQRTAIRKQPPGSPRTRPSVCLSLRSPVVAIPCG
jgi:hypothetical protein